MHRALRSVLLAAVVLTLLSLVAGAVTGAENRETLAGEYFWQQGNHQGELEAVFTPDGADSWIVSFRFNFQGRAHVYRGTASGSLTDGPLEGQVKSDARRRTFTFAGTTSGGIFEGTHAELQDGREIRTGTLKLSR